MDELDPTARDLLRRYRDEVQLAAPARARVGDRIAASLADEPAHKPASSRRQVVIAAAVLTALAAALVLVCDVRGRLGDVASDGAAAPYVKQSPATRPVAPSVDEPAVTPEPSPAPAPAPPRRVDPPPAPDLAAELDLLRRARAAIDAGDPDGALALLAEHTRRFAAGQMQQDRRILHIEAVCAHGDPARARAEAAEFLRDHPGSPHAARVRTICEPAANVVTDPGAGGLPSHHD